MSRRILLIAVLVVLIGCQKFLNIDVEDEQSSRPKFTFLYAYPLHFGKLPVKVQLNAFWVYCKAEDSTVYVVWEIVADSLKTLDNIEYGIAPEGYRTLVPAVPLDSVRVYHVGASLKVEGDPSVVGAGGKFTIRKSNEK
jgi:hypothetical protein